MKNRKARRAADKKPAAESVANKTQQPIKYFVSFFCRAQKQPTRLGWLLGRRGKITDEYGSGIFDSNLKIDNIQALKEIETAICKQTAALDVKILNFKEIK